jgi:hypothetical protein
MKSLPRQQVFLAMFVAGPLDGQEYFVHPHTDAEGFHLRPARFQEFSTPVLDFNGDPTPRVALYRYCLTDEYPDNNGKWVYAYSDWSEACA